MISICIPIYNFNVAPLINELSGQAILLNVPYEIILIDDCSLEEYKLLNKEVCQKETYVELDQNMGRSGIRNLFLNYSKFDHLLFLDCDSLVESSDFLSKYINIVKEKKIDVICGGRIYPENRPGRNKRLRWKYGMIKESKPASVRNLTPYKSFMTNNFMIDRETFNKIKFDERITGYGHEDTLYGYRLKKAGAGILHIDNSVVNGDLEDNEEYLRKTEKGVINLVQILEYVHYDKDFINDVSILKFYYKIYFMQTVLRVIFILLNPFIKFLLVKGYIYLPLYNFYKLGILMQNMNHSAKMEYNDEN